MVWLDFLRQPLIKLFTGFSTDVFLNIILCTFEVFGWDVECSEVSQLKLSGILQKGGWSHTWLKCFMVFGAQSTAGLDWSLFNYNGWWERVSFENLSPVGCLCSWVSLMDEVHIQPILGLSQHLLWGLHRQRSAAQHRRVESSGLELNEAWLACALNKHSFYLHEFVK